MSQQLIIIVDVFLIAQATGCLLVTERLLHSYRDQICTGSLETTTYLYECGNNNI